MSFFSILLYILCVSYSIYCISFLGTLFYTIYKEREEEKNLFVEEFIDSDEES
jgi:hypothetical protein